MRRYQPGTKWLITNRCFQARFLMRPDPETLQMVGYWLARAAEQTGVVVHGAIFMSNHLHLLVTDPHGNLHRFADLLFTNLAKGINELRGRSGKVFHRRFSAEPVLDDGALLKCLSYLLLNPVKAGLVSRPERWPGLILWAHPGSPNTHIFTRLYKRSWERACAQAAARGRPAPSRASFSDQRTITIHPLPGAPGTPQAADTPGDPGLAPEAVKRMLRDLTIEANQERLEKGESFLGARAVCCQDPESAPKSPKRSPRPLCHAASSKLWRQFRTQWLSFTIAYREASDLLRSGRLGVPFPLWSFPPGRPLVRAPAMTLA